MQEYIIIELLIMISNLIIGFFNYKSGEHFLSMFNFFISGMALMAAILILIDN